MKYIHVITQTFKFSTRTQHTPKNGKMHQTKTYNYTLASLLRGKL